MEARKYLHEIGFKSDAEVIKTDIVALCRLMEEYAKYHHEQQVKNCALADVGGSLPSDDAKSWLKKYMDKKLMKNHPEYRTTENMVKYVFSKGWKMAKEQ